MKTKKIILFVLFSGIIVVAAVLLFSKQKTTAYTLTGNIKGLQCVAGKSKGMSYTKDYIYLYGPVKNGTQELDSAKVVNGPFYNKRYYRRAYKGNAYMYARKQ